MWPALQSLLWRKNIAGRLIFKCKACIKKIENDIMKKLLLLCLTLLLLLWQAYGITLTDHSKIKELSSFRIMGAIDLRTEKDYSAEVTYKSLNHEGGMTVTVLEILKNDVQNNTSGKWLYVLLTSPMWVESGEWIEKYHKFLIFLPDDMPCFDFEE